MMRCRRCGAELLDTDTFCGKCGQKVEKTAVCPNCGEELREGERFCHKCGTMVISEPEDDEIPVVPQKTVDIPFDEIEQGILLQAERAIVKRPEPEHRRPPEAEYRRPPEPEYRRPPEPEYRRPSEPEERRPPEPEDRARPERRRSEDYRRPPAGPENRRRFRDYEEEEEDEDEEDSKLKIVTTVLGIAVLVVVLAVAYILWSRNASSDENDGPKQEEEYSEDEEAGQVSEDGQEVQGRIQVLTNVNIRNKPSTEDSKVLMVAKKGETYEYFDLIDNAWYHIRLSDGTEAYISASSEYVEDLG